MDGGLVVDALGNRSSTAPAIEASIGVGRRAAPAVERLVGEHINSVIPAPADKAAPKVGASSKRKRVKKPVKKARG